MKTYGPAEQNESPGAHPCSHGQVAFSGARGRGRSASSGGAGKAGIRLRRNPVGPFPGTVSEIRYKWVKDLDTRPDVIKLLEQNRGGAS